MCLSSVVLIKSSISHPKKGIKLIKLTESLSTNSLGFKFELIAAFSTFWPCSSVPVKKNTLFPNNLLYRAIISQAILV